MILLNLKNKSVEVLLMNNELFTPLLAYILWVIVLYLLLTVMRAPSIWGVGGKDAADNPFLLVEKKANANLSNQFEWPVLFYVICLILIARPEFYQQSYLWAAWVFVIGRVMHSFVQIFTSNIRLRGSVFNINFLAVLYMWGLFGLDVLNQ
jgi:hypothetical protein